MSRRAREEWGEGVRGLGEELVDRAVWRAGRGDDPTQALHRDVAHLAEDPQQPELPHVAVVVLRQAGGEPLALGEQPFAQVVLDRRDGDFRPLGELRHPHGENLLGLLLTAGLDSATVVLESIAI